MAEGTFALSANSCYGRVKNYVALRPRGRKFVYFRYAMTGSGNAGLFVVCVCVCVSVDIVVLFFECRLFDGF